MPPAPLPENDDQYTSRKVRLPMYNHKHYGTRAQCFLVPLVKAAFIQAEKLKHVITSTAAKAEKGPPVFHEAVEQTGRQSPSTRTARVDGTAVQVASSKLRQRKREPRNSSEF